MTSPEVASPEVASQEVVNRNKREIISRVFFTAFFPELL
jgi:hypothetical protein